MFGERLVYADGYAKSWDLSQLTGKRWLCQLQTVFFIALSDISKIIH